MVCQRCGSKETRIELCTTGPHYGKVLCSDCGRFIKFAPRPSGGDAPADVMERVVPRTSPVRLRGSERQVQFAESCRDQLLYRTKHGGRPDLHAVAMCVADSSWFIANKEKPLAEIRWPSVEQMAERGDRESA